MTSWREGGGRYLQPPSLSSALSSEPEGKTSASPEATTPLPPPSSSSTSPSANVVTTTAQSPDPKDPSLRPAPPTRRPTPGLQYQIHHSSTTTYHDMLPAFVRATHSFFIINILTQFKEKSLVFRFAVQVCSVFSFCSCKGEIVTGAVKVLSSGGN